TGAELLDLKEAAGGPPRVAEVGVAQAHRPFEMIGGQVAANLVGGPAKPVGHVADRLQPAQAVDTDSERLGQHRQNQHNQGDRNHQLDEGESLAPSHGCSSVGTGTYLTAARSWPNSPEFGPSGSRNLTKARQSPESRGVLKRL